MKHLILVLTAVCLLCLLPCALAEEETFAPQGNYRVFCADGLYGVQTLDGETVIPAKFDGIEPLHGDLCVVEQLDGDDRTCGLWRLSIREELLPCKYWGFEIVGDMVLSGGIFNSEANGYYMCELYDPDSRAFVISEDMENHYGIYSLADGQLFMMYVPFLDEASAIHVIRPDGTSLMSVTVGDAGMNANSDGILAVDGWDELEGWEWNEGTRYFNTVTEAWMDGTWMYGFPFADGFAAVCGEDWNWYVIDEIGKTVTPAYSWIANEHDTCLYGQGLFSVKQNNRWYIIQTFSDTEPETLLGPVKCSSDPHYLGNGVFALPTEEGEIVFSATNRQILLPENTFAYDAFITHCTILKTNEKKGFLFDDLTVIEPTYNDALPFLGEFGFVKISDTWHPIDRNGQVDMDVSYADAGISWDQSFYCVELESGDVLCLNPELQPITHQCWMEYGWW